MAVHALASPRRYTRHRTYTYITGIAVYRGCPEGSDASRRMPGHGAAVLRPRGDTGRPRTSTTSSTRSLQRCDFASGGGLGAIWVHRPLNTGFAGHMCESSGESLESPLLPTVGPCHATRPRRSPPPRARATSTSPTGASQRCARAGAAPLGLAACSSRALRAHARSAHNRHASTQRADA